jgi:hypothetical protein
MMITGLLALHPGLAANSRLPALARDEQRVRVVEIAILLGAGVCAALATAFLELRLRIPGHAILRAIFPMALGLALAPRRGGGTLMGTSALASALVIQGGHFASIGLGALTSLALTGPLLDAALRRARYGWQLLLGFAAAGVASNLLALAVRTGAKAMGWERGMARPMGTWWNQAIITYAVCGLLAGLISGLIWFHVTSRSRRNIEEPPA